jgi:hypothetical protein
MLIQRANKLCAEPTPYQPLGHWVGACLRGRLGQKPPPSGGGACHWLKSGFWAPEHARCGDLRDSSANTLRSSARSMISGSRW